jgi:hypothetical protein
VPPSPPRCHPSGRAYRYAEGSPDLTQVPLISVEERELLLAEARSFNRWVGGQLPKPRKPVKVVTGNGGRPGDDYNQRGCWEDLLQKHGWDLVGTNGEAGYWRRPGKVEWGHSASLNYEGSDLFYVFSSNALPFEKNHAYSKFAVYALLEHDGNFSKAASELYDRGFGRGPLMPGKRRGGLGGVTKISL